MCLLLRLAWMTLTHLSRWVKIYMERTWSARPFRFAFGNIRLLITEIRRKCWLTNLAFSNALLVDSSYLRRSYFRTSFRTMVVDKTDEKALTNPISNTAYDSVYGGVDDSFAISYVHIQTTWLGVIRPYSTCLWTSTHINTVLYCGLRCWQHNHQDGSMWNNWSAMNSPNRSSNRSANWTSEHLEHAEQPCYSIAFVLFIFTENPFFDFFRQELSTPNLRESNRELWKSLRWRSYLRNLDLYLRDVMDNRLELERRGREPPKVRFINRWISFSFVGQQPRLHGSFYSSFAHHTLEARRCQHRVWEAFVHCLQ